MSEDDLAAALAMAAAADGEEKKDAAVDGDGDESMAKGDDDDDDNFGLSRGNDAKDGSYYLQWLAGRPDPITDAMAANAGCYWPTKALDTKAVYLLDAKRHLKMLAHATYDVKGKVAVALSAAAAAEKLEVPVLGDYVEMDDDDEKDGERKKSKKRKAPKAKADPKFYPLIRSMHQTVEQAYQLTWETGIGVVSWVTLGLGDWIGGEKAKKRAQSGYKYKEKEPRPAQDIAKAKTQITITTKAWDPEFRDENGQDPRMLHRFWLRQQQNHAICVIIVRNNLRPVAIAKCRDALITDKRNAIDAVLKDKETEVRARLKAKAITRMEAEAELDAAEQNMQVDISKISIEDLATKFMNSEYFNSGIKKSTSSDTPHELSISFSRYVTRSPTKEEELLFAKNPPTDFKNDAERRLWEKRHLLMNPPRIVDLKSFGKPAHEVPVQDIVVWGNDRCSLVVEQSVGVRAKIGIYENYHEIRWHSRGGMGDGGTSTKTNYKSADASEYKPIPEADGYNATSRGASLAEFAEPDETVLKMLEYVEKKVDQQKKAATTSASSSSGKASPSKRQRVTAGGSSPSKRSGLRSDTA